MRWIDGCTYTARFSLVVHLFLFSLLDTTERMADLKITSHRKAVHGERTRNAKLIPDQLSEDQERLGSAR